MTTESSPFSRLLDNELYSPAASTHPIAATSTLGERFAKLKQQARVRLASPSFDREDWVYTNPEKLSAALSEAVKPSVDTPAHTPFRDREELRIYLESRGIPLLPSAIIITNGTSVDCSASISDGTISTRGITPLDASRPDDEAWTAFGSLSSESENPFVHLNEAALNSAVGVRAHKNSSCSEVIQIIHLVDSARAAPPRTVIIAEECSSLTIMETIVCLGEDGPRAPAVTEIMLAPGSHCSYTRLLDGPPSLQAVSSLFISADRDSSCHTFSMNTEGAILRNEIIPSLIGTGASVKVSGLTLGSDTQHSDTAVSMEHAAPHGESRQLFKGIYAGRSTGAFSGTIIVREGAQKTNAFQSSKSILVSPDAAVNTKPRLKIWADDVKCSHGATVGQLDEAALFYLRSRGVPLNTAKILLLHAFIGEVLSEIDSMEVREVIAQIVERRMKVVLEAAK